MVKWGFCSLKLLPLIPVSTLAIVRVVAREFLVPVVFVGIFREIDNFIESCLNLAKFYVILQFLTLECWVLELKLFINGGL